jgi:uncharacterized protein (TIGR02266 family)
MPVPPDASDRGSNLRRYTRRPVEIEITLESESQLYSGFSENFSEGGVFVATHLLRPVGARVEVAFTLPGLTTPIRVEGAVRWVREHTETSDAPPGIGIEFGPLRREDLEAIRRFCSARSPLFYD